jgi:hypothetical protein
MVFGGHPLGGSPWVIRRRRKIMNQPRGPQDLTNEELLEEFQSAIWADAIEEAEEMSLRTVETKNEILRRMQAVGSG